MRAKVYIETTIVSYLTAWRSPQLLTAAHQEATREWWDNQRHRFELFISAAVRQEAICGDPDAVRRRMEILTQLPEVAISGEAESLALALITKMAMPSKSHVDALHIAIATTHGLDYLLTWNCRRIANAELRTRIEGICEDAGYRIPIICTPLELIDE